MTTFKYILIAILLGINFVSCDPPSVNDEIGIEQTEVQGTKGTDQGLGDDDN